MIELGRHLLCSLPRLLFILAHYQDSSALSSGDKANTKLSAASAASRRALAVGWALELSDLVPISRLLTPWTNTVTSQSAAYPRVRYQDGRKLVVPRKVEACQIYSPCTYRSHRIDQCRTYCTVDVHILQDPRKLGQTTIDEPGAGNGVRQRPRQLGCGEWGRPVWRREGMCCTSLPCLPNLYSN